PDFDDGIAEGWDLTLADADIIASEPDVTVTYYTTREAAEAGEPGTEIVMPFTNTVPFAQTVYARVEKDVPPAFLGCYTIVELQLIVIPAPDAPIAPFQDPFIGWDDNGNGSATFDLTLQDAGIIGNQTASDFTPITYYDTSYDDALAGINAIGNPQAYLALGGETIWFRIQSLVTGCVRVGSFQLAIELFPTIGAGDDLNECDDLTLESTDIDGTAIFDLTVNTALIQMGNQDLEVYYY